MIAAVAALAVTATGTLARLAAQARRARRKEAGTFAGLSLEIQAICVAPIAAEADVIAMPSRRLSEEPLRLAA